MHLLAVLARHVSAAQYSNFCFPENIVIPKFLLRTFTWNYIIQVYTGLDKKGVVSLIICVLYIAYSPSGVSFHETFT